METLRMVVVEATDDPDAFVVQSRPPWWEPLYIGVCVVLDNLGLIQADPVVMAMFVIQHTRVWSRAGQGPWRYEGKAIIDD